ncbi:MAG: DUF6722 family protein [Elusimicrobiota bacterium]
MNRKQRDNLAKYAYDASKIFLTALVLVQIMDEKRFNIWLFIDAVIIVLALLFLGFCLDKEE